MRTLIALLLMLGSANAATVTLSYDGTLRDRVGQGEARLSGDGQLDGTFTLAITGATSPLIRLDLRNAAGGLWNTQPSDGFWTLGVAPGLDATLLNFPNDAINFTAPASLKLFASDYVGVMFATGASFTLTAVFADGSVASTKYVIGASVPPPPPPVINPDPPPPPLNNGISADSPFELRMERRPFTITLEPGATFTQRQYTLPDGSTVIEFDVK